MIHTILAIEAIISIQSIPIYCAKKPLFYNNPVLHCRKNCTSSNLEELVLHSEIELLNDKNGL